MVDTERPAFQSSDLMNMVRGGGVDIVPAGEVMVGAFKGAHGGATFDHVRAALHQPYLHEYWLTIKVSLITAAGGAVLGLLIAYAAIREGTPRFIRTALTTFAGVAANFAGIPLAFAFISTLGPLGIITVFAAAQILLLASELGDRWADVVISNGVLNLFPDKLAGLQEMARVLKPDGRLQIGDILVQKAVPEKGKQDINLWKG